MSVSVNAVDLFSVNGLVAVITGGGSGSSLYPYLYSFIVAVLRNKMLADSREGIGLMMAKALEANGALKVYIIGRRLQTLQTAAKQGKFGNIIPLQGDVTSKEDLTRIVKHIESETGYVDLLVANAGVSGPDLTGLSFNSSLLEVRDKLWSPDFDVFAGTYAVNTAATFFTIVAFLELLNKGNQKNEGSGKQRSQIVATSSISGFNRNVPGGFAYGGSKAATTQMMKQFATFLAPWGIRSNVIAPGIYPSEMTTANLAREDEEPKKVYPASVIPEERIGDEQDIAGAILFLASRAGAYLNGNVLITDGGRLSVMPSSY
ncbi:uncharacterized protein PV09_08620 [Verruconis gallopava]|uniref:Uncharacterized protein n=1 Tax=Verruconis gallopava TaxID=253628 RepID=A0A0D1YG97_9PEZI|nr:uncharacterized protein PV09_08620 [Verruconis gallopava]KIV99816.1 hypothetical protein PV09_08620 [Verruconis gallopava]